MGQEKDGIEVSQKFGKVTLRVADKEDDYMIFLELPLFGLPSSTGVEDLQRAIAGIEALKSRIARMRAVEY